VHTTIITRSEGGEDSAGRDGRTPSAADARAAVRVAARTAVDPTARLSNGVRLWGHGVAVAGCCHDERAVWVRAQLPVPDAASASVAAWRLQLLRQAEGIREVRPAPITLSGQNAIALEIGPFALRRGGVHGQSLEQYSSQWVDVNAAATTLLYCFACLSAGLNEEPEITFDESDSALSFLHAELRSLDAAYLSSPDVRPAEGVRRPRSGTSSAHNRVSERRRCAYLIYVEGQKQVMRDAIHAIQLMVSDSAPLAEPHRRVYTTSGAVLDGAECTLVVAAAETYAAQHGWSTRRHIAYPTHDLPCAVLGTTGAKLRRKVEQRLLPELAERFLLEPAHLAVQDLFVAKYSSAPDGLRELEAHEDGNEFSFVLALNSAGEYEGGGTKFLEVDGTPTYRPDRGFATMFAGKNRHCGMAIQAGVRYILAGFLKYST
jgi:hypothetical protein